jgi:deoxyhypusine monooxygenase
MATYISPPLPSLVSCILDISQPVAKRTIAAFHLRTLGTAEAAAAVAKALQIREDGALMRHELAYILGQMQHPESCEVLASILEDESDDVLVRHESAEAIGAIGDERYLPVLEKYSTHSAPEISETCQIAIDLINWNKKQAAMEKEAAQGSSNKLYLSHDPAPAVPENLSIQELQKRLMDTSLSLFQRYRAMFSLRDRGSRTAVRYSVTKSLSFWARCNALLLLMV